MLVHALGLDLLKQRAGVGDGEAQFSLGSWLMSEAGRAAGMPTWDTTGGRSPQGDVGFALRTAQCPGRSPKCDDSMEHPRERAASACLRSLQGSALAPVRLVT